MRMVRFCEVNALAEEYQLRGKWNCVSCSTRSRGVMTCAFREKLPDVSEAMRTIIGTSLRFLDVRAGLAPYEPSKPALVRANATNRIELGVGGQGARSHLLYFRNRSVLTEKTRCTLGRRIASAVVSFELLKNMYFFLLGTGHKKSNSGQYESERI